MANGKVAVKAGWAVCLALLVGSGFLPPVRGGDGGAAADNAELQRIFEEDQSDRTPGPHGIDWSVVKPRDDARLKRTRELYQAGALRTGADWLNAAFVFQHSSESDDYLLAHEMCVAAVALGEKRAQWLAAAAEDRFLRSIGRKQRFGTQYERSAEGGMKLAETADQVTDQLRAALGAPSLAEARANERRFEK